MQNAKTKRSLNYERWSFTRIEPQVGSSEKRFRYICFMEDDLLHAMSKLGYAWFHMFSLKVFVYSKEHSAYSENKVTVENTSSGRLNEVKNNGKSLTVRPKK